MNKVYNHHRHWSKYPRRNDKKFRRNFDGFENAKNTDLIDFSYNLCNSDDSGEIFKGRKCSNIPTEFWRIPKWWKYWFNRISIQFTRFRRFRRNLKGGNVLIFRRNFDGFRNDENTDLIDFPYNLCNSDDSDGIWRCGGGRF